MTALITSAAYVNTELIAEFGAIPPCFLPLGNSLLLLQQVSALRRAGETEIYVSLPAGFRLDLIQEAMLKEMGVKVIRCPEGISLGRSVLHCLNSIGSLTSLRLLHGDTLVDPECVAQGGDYWAVSDLASSYPWGVAYTQEDQIVGIGSETTLGTAHAFDLAASLVLVGYFSFDAPNNFARALQYSNGDFLTALAFYAAEQTVRPIVVETWLDCGHLQNYYRSRGSYAAARSFNNLKISGGVVRKASQQRTKLAAEANWFEQIPSDLQTYVARLVYSGPVDDTYFAYATEYEPYPSLHELFVFGRLHQRAWKQIFASCFEVMEQFAQVKSEVSTTSVLTLLGSGKTRSRLDHFEKEMGFDLSQPTELNGQAMPSFRQIADHMSELVERAPEGRQNIMHGDMCFTNILFNTRSGRVRLIDPRGTLNGTDMTIYGDVRYDMAKFLHSVVGRYDLILSGRYSLNYDFQARMAFEFDLPPDRDNEWMDSYIWSQSIGPVRFDQPEIKALLVLLFISMLPLHADNHERQMAFMANSLRLYHTLFEAST